jgi:hypothetical protein
MRHAQLEGHSEARFPDSLKRFQLNLYGPTILPYFRTHQFLDYFFEKVVKSPDAVIHHPVTNDGYVWLARADIVLDEARFALLLPQAMDNQMLEGGTMADRHCALHARLDQNVVIEPWMYSHVGRYVSALLQEEQQERSRHHRRAPRKIEVPK